MERPEHGPADIERLLRAYPFDELPEADRARVLLHVDGRAEYEAMRALLLGVERGAGRLPAIAPEESVRINVMAAFREAHAARRGPWLNGLLAVLWPQELRHAWRPALALGTLALLVVGGIVAVRQFDRGGTDELAEVRPTETPAAPSTGDAVEEAVPLPVEEPPAAPPVADHAPAEVAEVVPDRTTRTDDAAGVAVAHEVMEAEDAAYLAEAPAPAAAKTESIAMDEVVIEGQGARGRAVGAKELARNQSMADAEMTSGMNSRTEAEKAGDRRAMAHGRRLGDDAALMELLAAGW